MPARVTFRICDGPLAGQQFTFEDRSINVMGRAKGCRPRLLQDAEEPTAWENRRISRHHCLLDINPPDVRIRDLGSLNGTFVNGRKIGQRGKDEKPGGSFPEYDLNDGDELRLGKGRGELRVHVNVFVPIVCAECGAEMNEGELAWAAGETAACVCEMCGKGPEQANGSAEMRRTMPEPAKLCARCGCDVTGQTGANRPGEFLCGSCRDDPVGLLRNLIRAAACGDRALVAVEGYEIVRELGRGGMGAVYLARHEKSGRQVALKVMLPKVAANSRAVDRFLRESRNTQALRHRNVVRLWESGCSEGTLFFTLEYCQGGSVDKLMACNGGVLPIGKAVRIILQTLDGLDYAHHAEIPEVQLRDGRIGRGRGLVHRDIKPQNVFLSIGSGAQVAKIGDYGLAKAFDMAGLSGHTYMGEVSGTPQFMPRQQVLHFKELRPAADVWATAATLYFMLTARPPREFPKDANPWQVILETRPVPIRQRDRAIPAPLAKVIDHALVDKPQIGFQSAAEFKQALVQVIG